MNKNLIKIIKTLSPEERRFFKLREHIYAKANQKIYMALYARIVAAIDRGEDNPEDEILKELLTSDNTLTSAKIQSAGNYLYEILTQSLRHQYEDKNQDIELRNILYEGKILEQRGMQEAAIEKYEFVLAKSLKYQMHHLSLEVIKVIVSLFSQFDPKNYVSMIRKHLGDMTAINQLLYNETNLFNINYDLFVIYRTKSNTQDKETLERIRYGIQQLEKLPKNEENFWDNIYYNLIGATLAQLKDSPVEAQERYERIIAIWDEEKFAQMKHLYMRTYIIHLGNCITFCIINFDYYKVKKFIDIFHEVKSNNIDEEAEIFQILNYFEHLYLLNTGDLEKAKFMESAILRGIDKYKGKINKARKRTFFYNMMLVNFALENYSDALDFHKMLLEKSPHREDLSIGGQLFELIILYKQKTHGKLDTKVKALIANLSYKKIYHDFERIVLNLLTKAIRFEDAHPDEANKKKHLLPMFEEARSKLEVMAQREDFIAPESFKAIELWILSEIEGRPFAEYLKAKFAN